MQPLLKIFTMLHGITSCYSVATQPRATMSTFIYRRDRLAYLHCTVQCNAKNQSNLAACCSAVNKLHKMQ